MCRAWVVERSREGSTPYVRHKLNCAEHGWRNPFQMCRTSVPKVLNMGGREVYKCALQSSTHKQLPRNCAEEGGRLPMFSNSQGSVDVQNVILEKLVPPSSILFLDEHPAIGFERVAPELHSDVTDVRTSFAHLRTLSSKDHV